MSIHQTAIVDPEAQIDLSVDIGPYAVIGPHVKVGSGTKIGAHVVIDGHTTIGASCNIFAGAAIGLAPQDLNYKDEPTGVTIGDRVTLREYVTVHRATGERNTEIGDDCFIMAYNHIAHDCQLGRGVIMANGNGLAGHVTIGDFTVMSGVCVFHQHVRVGRMVMMSALIGTRLDLPPFTLVDGRHAHFRGVNVIGLRRNGVGLAVRSCIKEAYRLLYLSGLNTSQALSRIQEEIELYPEVKEIIEFYQSSKRGVISAHERGEKAQHEVGADAP